VVLIPSMSRSWPMRVARIRSPRPVTAGVIRTNEASRKAGLFALATAGALLIVGIGALGR